MLQQTSKAVIYKEFGKPLEVLSLVESDVHGPGPQEVLVKLIASPIIPADFGSILGNYGKLKPLPATAGAMGIGEVVEVGNSVTDVGIGDTVRIPEEIGAWQEYCLIPVEELKVLPPGLDPQSACIAALNPPTVIRLLEDFGSLSSGDWVIQNAANSNVGIAIVQYAKKLGLKTVNLVRRDELIQPLLDLGADKVVTEENFNPREIESLTGEGRPKLAINSVGGHSALKILNALRSGGTHVTIGAMTFEPVRLPTRQLIFEDIRMCGFWLMQWRNQHTTAEVEALDNKVYSLIKDGTFNFPVAATYPVSHYRTALEHAGKPRFGTVLITADQ